MTTLAVFYAFVSMLDLLLTIGGLRMGYTEANSLMNIFTGNEAMFTGIKAGGTLIASFGFLTIRNRLVEKGLIEKLLVHSFVGALVVLQVAVAFMNAYLLGGGV